MFTAPLVLTASGIGITTLIAGYLTYKTHKRFGKLDRSLRDATRKLGRVLDKVDRSRKSLQGVSKKQQALLDKIARLEGKVRTQQQALDQLGRVVADAKLESGYLTALSSLPLRFPLFFGRWSIDGVTAKCIVDTVHEIRPKVVLELGAGSSTVLVAATLEALEMQATRHIAIDHLENFLNITRQNFAVQGLKRTAEFWHCPLVPASSSGDPDWYFGLPERLVETKIDLLIVDGPPGHSHPEARRPALEVLAPFLSEDAVVILDDASRPEELRIVELWRTKFPDFEVELARHGKGCARLTRGRFRS